MKLLQLIDEIKVVGYGGPVVSISATFLSNDELDEDYFTQPQWDFKVLTLREAKLELDKFQRTNSADAFELPLAIDPEFREMGYSLGNAVACLPRPTRDTYYELDGFPGEGYGYQSEYGGQNPGQEWRHGVIFVRVFHPVEITGEDFDSLNEYIDFSVYLGSKISFLEAFTRLASKSEINEIAVVPPGRVIVGFPFVHDPIGGEYLKTDEAEILSLDSLRSKFRECEESGLIEVFICDDFTESIVERAVCCLPRLPENSKLPGGFKFLDLDEISTEGMVFAIIEKFPNMTLPTIRTGLNNYFLDYDSGDDVSFQEALQHLFDTGI